jgi:hypothetical protein
VAAVGEVLFRTVVQALLHTLAHTFSIHLLYAEKEARVPWIVIRPIPLKLTVSEIVYLTPIVVP